MGINSSGKRRLFVTVCVLVSLTITQSISVHAANGFKFSTRGAPSLQELDRLQNATVKKAIPFDQWPEIPLPLSNNILTNNSSTSNEQIESLRSGEDYFMAGMRTSNYSYCGYYVDIYAGDIENTDPTHVDVRLTPHIGDSSAEDYLAIVLQDSGDDEEVELWTYQRYGESFSYHGQIPKTEWSRFCIFVYSNYHYSILYAPVGDELEVIRYGTYEGASRNCMVFNFLEHAVDPGYSCPEHGESDWWNMYLYSSGGGPYAWNTSISTSDYVIPSSGNPLYKYYSYASPSYYLITSSP